MSERYGIYFAPAVTSPLWSLASLWLARDAATGETIEAEAGGLSFERRFPLTISARRYGFHATLKAPIGLDSKLEGKDLDRALKAYAEVQAPVDMGPIVLRAIGRFLALVPENQSAELTEFAGRIVTDFDGFRAPMPPAERAKRLGEGKLSERQVELVDRYGYPYVLEEFRLHMTLTDRLQPEDHDEIFAAASDWFAPVIGQNLLLDRLVLFRESEPGAPFMRLRDYPLASD